MQNSAAANTPFTGDSRMRARLGTSLLAVCTLSLTVVAGAQVQNPVTNGLRAIEQRYAKNIVDAAEEMPADKYGYKPTTAQIIFFFLMARPPPESTLFPSGALSG